MNASNINTGALAQEAADALVSKLKEITDSSIADRREYFLGELSRPIDGSMSLCGLIVTLSLWTDEEFVGILQQVFPPPSEEQLKDGDADLLIQTIVTQPKIYKVSGKIPICVVGGRNLLHLLAEFNYPVTLKYLLEDLQCKEDVDDAGFLPRDCASKECRELFLRLDADLSRQVRSPLTVKDYNTQLREYTSKLVDMETREKESELYKVQKDIDGIDIPAWEVLSDHPARVRDYSTHLGSIYCPLALMKERKSALLISNFGPTIECISPEIIVFHNFLSPAQRAFFMDTVSQINLIGGTTPPNSLNRKGFTCRGTLLAPYVYYFARSILKGQHLLGIEGSIVESLNDIHSFVITYESSTDTGDSTAATLPKHVDNSIWTANICLTAHNAENAVVFSTSEYERNTKQISCPGHGENCIQTEEDNKNESSHQVILHSGDLLLHRGDIFHATVGNVSQNGGFRTNLVVWFKTGYRSDVEKEV